MQGFGERKMPVALEGASVAGVVNEAPGGHRKSWVCRGNGGCVCVWHHMGPSGHLKNFILKLRVLASHSVTRARKLTQTYLEGTLLAHITAFLGYGVWCVCVGGKLPKSPDLLTCSLWLVSFSPSSHIWSLREDTDWSSLGHRAFLNQSLRTGDKVLWLASLDPMSVPYRDQGWEIISRKCIKGLFCQVEKIHHLRKQEWMLSRHK